jgi:hypothetical protein
MSFTTGTLFQRESVQLAGLFVEFKDWNAVRDRVLSDNLLQARTLNTSRRVCREIISRLRQLAPTELHLLIDATSQEQAYLLWLGICRRYKFIADFAIEVLRERHITLKTDLQPVDFDSFFNSKSQWHPELDEVTATTRQKLRQVLFKILKEVGLLGASNTIIPVTLTPRLLEAIAPENTQDLLFFPAHDSDLKRA